MEGELNKNLTPAQSLIDPIGSAIIFIGEDFVLSGILDRAEKSHGYFVEIADVLIQLGSRNLIENGDVEGAKKFAICANNMKKEAEGDLSLLKGGNVPGRRNNIFLCSIWSSIEFMLDEITQRIMCCHLNTEEVLKKNGIKLNSKINKNLSSRKIREWKGNIKGEMELKKYSIILNEYDIKVFYDSYLIERVNLISAKRNCIMHNKSCVDKIFLENVIDSKLKIGDQILTSKDDLRECFNVCSQVAVETMRATVDFVKRNNYSW